MKVWRLIFLLPLLCPLTLQAKINAGIDEISVDTRMTFHQQTEKGVYSSHFQGDYFNLHVKGEIAEGLSFRIRQRFNKGIDQANPFNATDFLYLK